MSPPLKPAEVAQVVTDEDSFGHEMKVAAIFSAFPNFKVEHGGTYIDSVSGKPRQFDFRAATETQEGMIFLGVECKNLSEYSPMVISGRARTHAESYHEIVRSSPASTEGGFCAETLVTRANESIYQPGEFCGKSILRIQRDRKNPPKSIPDSDIYDKWAQALASCDDLLDRARRLAATRRYDQDSAVLPIVVVADGVLWQCPYDGTGRLHGPPTLQDHLTFFVGREYGAGKTVRHRINISHTHFCTLTGFRTFLSRLTSDAVYLHRLFRRQEVRK